MNNFRVYSECYSQIWMQAFYRDGKAFKLLVKLSFTISILLKECFSRPIFALIPNLTWIFWLNLYYRSQNKNANVRAMRMKKWRHVFSFSWREVQILPFRFIESHFRALKKAESKFLDQIWNRQKNKSRSSGSFFSYVKSEFQPFWSVRLCLGYNKDSINIFTPNSESTQKQISKHDMFWIM